MEPEVYEIERREQRRNWWFRGRRRILADLLAPLGLPLGARLLDFACGTGANAPVLRTRGFSVGVDASPHALAGEPNGHHVRLRADVLRLPVRDDAFDAAIALDILEHLHDDYAGARELWRVLRPGAPVVVFVPAFQWLWGGQDIVSHHQRRYQRSQLIRLLEDSGFAIERTTYFNTLLMLPILAVRRAMSATRVVLDSENQLTGPLANEILAAVFAVEAPVLRRFDLPIGVSIAAVARKR